MEVFVEEFRDELEILLVELLYKEDKWMVRANEDYDEKLKTLYEYTGKKKIWETNKTALEYKMAPKLSEGYIHLVAQLAKPLDKG